MKKVRDIMLADVVSVGPEASVFEAVQLMNEKNIGSVVVVGEEKTLGIFTERDLITKLAEIIGKGGLEKAKVRDYMSKELGTADPDQTATMYIGFMREKHIRHLPVKEDEQIVGILSLRDLMWYYHDELQRQVLEKIKNVEKLQEATRNVRELHLQLVKASKMAVVGEVGSAIIHELEVPLTDILNFLKVTEKEEEWGSEETQGFKVMEKRCEYIINVLEKLSAFIRDTGLQLGELRCDEIIESTLEFSAHMLASKHIAIERQYGTDLPSIKGNSAELQLVVLNMIMNAHDAMAGEGVFTIKTEVVSEGDEEFVQMSFCDTGCGIKEEDMDKIFTRFFTTKFEGEHLGLGLSIAQTIVKTCKGKILVESEEGQGATFRVLIPVFKNS